MPPIGDARSPRLLWAVLSSNLLSCVTKNTAERIYHQSRTTKSPSELHFVYYCTVVPIFANPVRNPRTSPWKCRLRQPRIGAAQTGWDLDPPSELRPAKHRVVSGKSQFLVQISGPFRTGPFHARALVCFGKARSGGLRVWEANTTPCLGLRRTILVGGRCPCRLRRTRGF